MVIKSQAEIASMQQAGRLTGETLDYIQGLIRPGVTTLELNNAADEFIRSRKGIPSFLNYNGFPRSVCISINEEVVHGIPNKKRVLQDGDIVSVDVGVEYDGWQGDAARTYLVGNVAPEVQELVKVTKECFFQGLAFCKVGYRLGDVAAAIQSHAESHGYGVVRDLIGHGIGRKLHEPPDVPNFGKAGHGVRLVAGMTIAIEPMINLGTWEVRVLEDGWTVVARDGKPSAHYENTVAITDGEPLVLTLL